MFPPEDEKHDVILMYGYNFMDCFQFYLYCYKIPPVSNASSAIHPSFNYTIIVRLVRLIKYSKSAVKVQ